MTNNLNKQEQMTKDNAQREAAAENLWAEFIDDQPPLTDKFTEYKRAFGLGFDAGLAANAEQLERALTEAAKPKYGVGGRFLGNWELGFEEGRKATIKAIRAALGGTNES